MKIPAMKPMKVRLSSLNMAAYNPRRISDREMDELKASLKAHGFVTTLVVRREGMELIGGHQRVKALRELAGEAGIEPPTEVWAVVLDIDTRTAKQMNVALNRINGEFDDLLLAQLFRDIGEITDADARAMGFISDEVQALLKSAAEPDAIANALEREAAGLIGVSSKPSLVVEFETAKQRDEIRDFLKRRAKQEGCFAGSILLKELRLVMHKK